MTRTFASVNDWWRYRQEQQAKEDEERRAKEEADALAAPRADADSMPSDESPPTPRYSLADWIWGEAGGPFAPIPPTMAPARSPIPALWSGQLGALPFAPGPAPFGMMPPDRYAGSSPTMDVGWRSPTTIPGRDLPMPGLPGVWDPWRWHAEQGIRGLIDVWRRVFSGSGGGSNYDPDCDEEWDTARKRCRDELAKPYPSRTITGGHLDVEDCARGHVSERCLGNEVDRPKRKPTRPWKPD